jgi:hypothetical protein
MKVSKRARKLVLKPIAVLMTVCMLVSMFSVAGAANERGGSLVFDDYRSEFIFSDDIDFQTAQLIANSISGESALLNSGSSLIAPASILCLFGHSLAQTTVRQVEHNVWAASPRCRETVYNVTYCTRSSCSHIVYTVRSQARIVCC